MAENKETRYVVLEGGNADGRIFDIRTSHGLAQNFSFTIDGDHYRTCGEYRDEREIMVYDG